MIEKVKPLITVLGVLGKQGQSVAQTLIKSGFYRVRGITRRIDSPVRYDTDPDQKINSTSSVSDVLSVQNMVPFNKQKIKTIKNSFKQTRPENELIVLEFFKEEKRSALEAEKFYNFYEA